jgi:hypothetical protein
MSNSIYQINKKCLKNDECDDGYSCCLQKWDEHKNEIKSHTFGLCIQDGMCNESTGLWYSKVNGEIKKGTRENYTVHTVEGYENCANSNTNALLIAIPLTVLLLVLVYKTT